MKNTIRMLTVSLFAVLLVSSCTSTKIVAMWQDPNHEKHPAAKLFVIGTVKDRGPRSLLEDALVRELKGRGNEATSSTAQFPDREVPPRSVVEPKVRELGADAVLVVRFVKKESSDIHIPTRLYAAPENFDANWDELGVMTEPAPQIVSSDYDVVVLKTTLYDTGSGKAVWSALSETKYQGPGIEQIKPFASFIVKELAAAHLIR